MKKTQHTSILILDVVKRLRGPFNSINILLKKLENSNERLSKNFRGTMRACIVNVIQVSNSVSLFLEHGEIKQPNIFASKKPENLCDLVRILVDH